PVLRLRMGMESGVRLVRPDRHLPEAVSGLLRYAAVPRGSARVSAAVRPARSPARIQGESGDGTGRGAEGAGRGTVAAGRRRDGRSAASRRDSGAVAGTERPTGRDAAGSGRTRAGPAPGARACGPRGTGATFFRPGE